MISSLQRDEHSSTSVQKPDAPSPALYELRRAAVRSSSARRDRERSDDALAASDEDHNGSEDDAPGTDLRLNVDTRAIRQIADAADVVEGVEAEESHGGELEDDASEHKSQPRVPRPVRGGLTPP